MPTSTKARYKSRSRTVKLLGEIHQEVRSVKKDTNFLLYEISVNGKRGLQPILEDHDKKLSSITPRVEEMWTVTDRLRIRFKFIRVLRELIEKTPMLRWLFNSRTFIWMLRVFVLLLMSALGYDVSIHVWKLFSGV
jgi:hypothetical protein